MLVFAFNFLKYASTNIAYIQKIAQVLRVRLDELLHSVYTCYITVRIRRTAPALVGDPFPVVVSQAQYWQLLSVTINWIGLFLNVIKMKR